MAKIDELTIAVRTIIVEGGCKLIAEERDEQINTHGYMTSADTLYENDELVRAAVAYALPDSHVRKFLVGLDATPADWPWPKEYYKRADGTIEGRIKELAKAGALIAAEIDRLLLVKKEQES